MYRCHVVQQVVCDVGKTYDVTHHTVTVSRCAPECLQACADGACVDCFSGYGYGAPVASTGGGIGFGEILVLGVLAVIAFQVISSLTNAGGESFGAPTIWLHAMLAYTSMNVDQQLLISEINNSIVFPSVSLGQHSIHLCCSVVCYCVNAQRYCVSGYS